MSTTTSCVSKQPPPICSGRAARSWSREIREHIPSARTGALEIVALLALLVPFIGWLVGSVLVVVSQAWSRRDKIVGLTLLLLPVLLPLLVVIAQSGGSEHAPVPVGDTRPVGLKESGDSGPGALEFLVFAMLAGLPSALYLGWRLRRHPSHS